MLHARVWCRLLGILQSSLCTGIFGAFR
eukprot:SAG11_NODE_36364_length_262_cov_0.539877_1_plen_27_part_01